MVCLVAGTINLFWDYNPEKLDRTWSTDVKLVSIRLKKLFLRSALLMCSLSSDQGTGRERFLSSPSRFGGLPRQVSLPHWSRCSLGCPVGKALNMEKSTATTTKRNTH